MPVDPHTEAEELSAGAIAANDWLQAKLADAPLLLRGYAAKYLNLGSIGPLVQAIVTAVDKVRDAPPPTQEPTT